MWGSMFTFAGFKDFFTGGIFDLGLTPVDFVIVLLAVTLVFFVSRADAKRSIREWLYERPVASAAICASLLLVTLMLGAYGVGYDASQFIYNQF